MVPIGQLNQNLARVGQNFLVADSLTFGVGVGKMLTAQTVVCDGEFNGDGFVDDADCSIFVIAYDILDCADCSMPAGCPPDITRDGVVDGMYFTKFVVASDALVCP
ncbi:MAG: hypothetical protein ACREJD_16025 [Phycisphaerales bacterium]